MSWIGEVDEIKQDAEDHDVRPHLARSETHRR